LGARFRFWRRFGFGGALSHVNIVGRSKAEIAVGSYEDPVRIGIVVNL
jgi:hypothetical protein